MGTEKSEIMLSHEVKRLRKDGVVDNLIVNIDIPKLAKVIGSTEVWVCNVTIKGIPFPSEVTGVSSLDVVTRAAMRVGSILRSLPIADELVSGSTPNFGMPLCPFTTTTDSLEAEQNRAATHKPWFADELKRTKNG